MAVKLAAMDMADWTCLFLSVHGTIAERALLSIVLKSREVVGPLNPLHPRESPNFVKPDESNAAAFIGQEVLSLIHEVNVIYYTVHQSTRSH